MVRVVFSTNFDGFSCKDFDSATKLNFQVVYRDMSLPGVLILSAALPLNSNKLRNVEHLKHLRLINKSVGLTRASLVDGKNWVELRKIWLQNRTTKHNFLVKIN
jgi:hypothetical protein